MPSVTAAIEYLKHLQSKGRGNAPIHIVDIELEAQKRAKNDGPKPKTRFQIETDDPMLYSEFVAEKDRIVKRAGNKSIALGLMLDCWKALTNQVIDRIVASEEGAAQK